MDIILYLILLNCFSLAYEYGLWQVHKGDQFEDVREALSLSNYTAIESYNKGININYINPGDVFTVPYASACYPASWAVISSTPFLHLNNFGATDTVPQPTASIQVSKGSGVKSTAISSNEQPLLSVSTATSSLLSSISISTKTIEVPSPLSVASHSKTPIIKCRTSSGCKTGSEQYSFAQKFCTAYKAAEISNSSNTITALYRDRNNNIYEYSFAWIPSCTGESIQLQEAFPECKDTYASLWKDCKMLYL